MVELVYTLVLEASAARLKSSSLFLGTKYYGGLAERLRQQFAKLSLGNRWIGSIPILSAKNNKKETQCLNQVRHLI